MFEIADDPKTDKARFIPVVIRALKFRSSSLGKRTLSRLKKLDKKLTGTTFWDRFCRYVLYTTWDEDHSLKAGSLVEEVLPPQRVRRLARELIRNQALFTRHISQLIAVEGHRLAQFGYEVAKQQGNAVLDDPTFKALESCAQSANGEFLGGYLSAIRERDSARWENLLLKLLRTEALRDVGIACVFRSGVSEQIVRELLDLYRATHIGSNVFRRVGLSARESEVPESLVDEVVGVLTDRGDEAAMGICSELVDDYYCRNAPAGTALPKAQVFRLITRVIAIKASRDSMRGFHWHRVANAYRKQYPDKDLDLLSKLLENFNSLSAARQGNDESQIADDIVRDRPKEAWKLIAAALERNDRLAHYIVTWLGDSGFEDHPAHGAMRFLDPDDIVAWTSSAPDQRIKLIYQGLPRTLDPESGGKITARFIETFGDRGNLSSALIWLYIHVGAWSGPRSAYLSRKRDAARDWMAKNSSLKIQSWLTSYIAALSQEIEAAQIQEERDF